MDDLISRAALLKECAECQKTDPYFEKRGWANHFISQAGEPSTEWYCVENMIENAPTADAIPVEWLEAKRERMASAGQDTAEQAIAYVLWLWRKEAKPDADGT